MRSGRGSGGTPSRIIILGTGGNALDILDVLHDLNDAAGEPVYECAGFLDDDPSRWGREILGVKVLGPLDAAPEFPDCSFVNGIGSPANFWRKEPIIARTGLPLERFATLAHPSASVSRTAGLGRGTVVLQNVTINTAAAIGHHVIILPNSVVSHHDVIGDYTCLATGVCLSGGVTVGKACYLGARAAVKENVSIGDGSLVGMGSVVLADVPPNSVVVGSPARFLRRAVEDARIAGRAGGP